MFSPIFSRADISILMAFASDKSLIVTKLDKGKGVVILDRSSYIEKMDTIVNDRSKFTVVADPILKTIRQVEDKINRLFTKLKSLGMISDEVYKRLFVSGSVPGILYGLPKIHKKCYYLCSQFSPLVALPLTICRSFLFLSFFP